MSLHTSIDRVLVWDAETTRLVPRTRVQIELRGNFGSVFAVAGPLYAEGAAEIAEAVRTLKARLLKSLPGVRDG